MLAETPTKTQKAVARSGNTKPLRRIRRITVGTMYKVSSIRANVLRMAYTFNTKVTSPTASKHTDSRCCHGLVMTHATRHSAIAPSLELRKSNQRVEASSMRHYHESSIPYHFNCFAPIERIVLVLLPCRLFAFHVSNAEAEQTPAVTP